MGKRKQKPTGQDARTPRHQDSKKDAKKDAASKQDKKEDTQSSKAKGGQPDHKVSDFLKEKRSPSPSIEETLKKSNALSENESGGECSDGYDSDSSASVKSYASVLQTKSPSSTTCEATNRSSLENSPPSTSKVEKKKRLPPITMRDGEEYMKLMDIFPANSYVATCRRGEFKISVFSEEVHTKMLQHFEKSKIEYYTNSLTKPIKAVIRGIPSAASSAEVLESLQEQLETKDISVTQMRKTTDEGKVALPLFLVTLPNLQLKKRLRELKLVMKIHVKIEDYIQKSPVVQCHNCQLFDHGSSRCKYKPRCVKCLLSHKTSECKKKPSDPPRCCNCEGEHPANFRGCPVYVKILEARTKQQQPASQEVKKTLLRGNQSQASGLIKDTPALTALNFPFFQQSSGITLKPDIAVIKAPAPATKSPESSQVTKKTEKPLKLARENKKRGKKQGQPVQANIPPPSNEEGQSQPSISDQSESRTPAAQIQLEASSSQSSMEDGLSSLSLILHDIHSNYDVKNTLKYVHVLLELLKYHRHPIIIQITQFLVDIALAAEEQQK
jgi:hypothetical protein